MQLFELIWWLLRSWRLWHVFVRPLYLQLLHGNFVRLNETDAVQFSKTLANRASSITDSQITRLLKERDWRARLTAAWLVGLMKRKSFVPAIGHMLLESQTVFAGQGYCMALALIGNEQCVDFLRSYLEASLPIRNGRYYDRLWVIGALAYLRDTRLPRFLDDELWRNGSDSMHPVTGIETFKEVTDYLFQHHLVRAH
jgi:Family of unknown function (DUF6000)